MVIWAAFGPLILFVRLVVWWAQADKKSHALFAQAWLSILTTVRGDLINAPVAA
jgi:hypothetical protein